MSDYNGWSNKQTWSAFLYIGNDQHSYNHWTSNARTAWQDAPNYWNTNGGDPLDRSGRARAMLGKWLKNSLDSSLDIMVESLPKHPIQGFFVDALTLGTQSVDEIELADALLDSCELEGYTKRKVMA